MGFSPDWALEPSGSRTKRTFLVPHIRKTNPVEEGLPSLLFIVSPMTLMLWVEIPAPACLRVLRISPLPIHDYVPVGARLESKPP